MPSSLNFRVATSADVPSVVSLVTAAYRGDASRAGWTTEADLLGGNRVDAELVQADLDAERSVVLLAEHDGELVGCVHINAVAEVAGRGYLGMFAISPTQQGGGWGSALMGAAEKYCADIWAITQMELTVIDVRTELIAFYERRGYRRTGETVGFPYGDERFGIPARDDLQMTVLRKTLAPQG